MDSNHGAPLIVHGGDANDKRYSEQASDNDLEASTCCFVRPGPAEKRYLGGRLSRNHAVVACAFVAMVLTTIVLCVGILVGGKGVAEGAIDAADIEVVMMDITGYADDASSFTADISASLQNTYPLGTYVKETKVDMRFQTSPGQYVSFAKFDFPALKVRASELKEFTINDAEVLVTDLDVFNLFCTQLLQEETAQVNFYTKSLSARALGITFTDMKMDKDIELVGINNFETFPFEITDIDVVGANEELNEIYMSLGAKLFNPSPVSFVDLGRMRLYIERNGVTIGYGESALFNEDATLYEPTPLVEGDNLFAFNGVIQRTAENSDTISEVMSRFSSGLDTDIVLRGAEDSTDIALLQGSLSQMSVSGVMPGLAEADSLIRYGSTAIPYDLMWKEDDTYKNREVCGDTGNKYALGADMILNNPFSVPITIQSGRLAVSLADAPETVENTEAGFYVFPPPYNTSMYLGYGIVEDILLRPGSESTTPFTTVSLDMCLEGVMDCGCEFQADFLQINPAGAVSGCPIISLVQYMEGYIGIGGTPNPPGMGAPGNAKAQAAGDVVAQIGDCGSAEGCIALDMTLTVDNIDIALAVDYSSFDFGCLF